MKREYFIAIEDFCINHKIEVSFISSLADTGVINITWIGEAAYIHIRQLKQLEKFIRLYFELDINPEGIATVAHLLERMAAMQNEILVLKNRLRLYE